jgi:hypothetical protein
MPSASSPNINNANAVITLVGKGPSATEISFTGMESLFYINAGKLVLDKNITLIGNASIMSVDPWISAVIRLSGGSLTMKDGATIRGNTGDEGGGVYVGGGEFTMEGGTISGNSATRVGGGVYVKGGKFTMKDGATISDKSAPYGGGVRVNGSTFNMEGGTISGNSATEYGGGVHVSNSTLFNKTGGFIYGDSDNTHTAGNTENTVTYPASGRGHAVIYTNSARYRDSDLGSEDDISTSNLTTNWSW